MVHHWRKRGPRLSQRWPNLGSRLVQAWFNIGAKLARKHGARALAWGSPHQENNHLGDQRIPPGGLPPSRHPAFLEGAPPPSPPTPRPLRTWGPGQGKFREGTHEVCGSRCKSGNARSAADRAFPDPPADSACVSVEGARSWGGPGSVKQMIPQRPKLESPLQAPKPPKPDRLAKRPLLDPKAIFP